MMKSISAVIEASERHKLGAFRHNLDFRGGGSQFQAWGLNFMQVGAGSGATLQLTGTFNQGQSHT